MTYDLYHHVTQRGIGRDTIDHWSIVGGEHWQICPFVPCWNHVFHVVHRTTFADDIAAVCLFEAMMAGVCSKSLCFWVWFWAYKCPLSISWHDVLLMTQLCTVTATWHTCVCYGLSVKDSCAQYVHILYILVCRCSVETLDSGTEESTHSWCNVFNAWLN